MKKKNPLRNEINNLKNQLEWVKIETNDIIGTILMEMKEGHFLDAFEMLEDLQERISKR